MPSNIEIKAHYNDEERLVTIMKLLGEKVEELVQKDTFFKTQEGRLKLREEIRNGESTSTLIGYKRTDDSGPTRSDFSKTVILNPSELCTILGSTLGVVGVVKKSRDLYLVRDLDGGDDCGLLSRVHIDSVEGLGKFLELEVMLESDLQESQGISFAKRLMKMLRIKEEELISEAYVDMLRKKRSL